VYRRGSSLLELIVVVAIVAILAAVAIPSFSRMLAHLQLRIAGTSLVQDLRDLQVHAIGEDCYYTIVFVTNAKRYYYREGTKSFAPAGAVRAERTLSSSAGFPLAAGKQSPMSVVFGPEASMVSPIVTMSFNAMGSCSDGRGPRDAHEPLWRSRGPDRDARRRLIRMEQVR